MKAPTTATGELLARQDRQQIQTRATANQGRTKGKSRFNLDIIRHFPYNVYIIHIHNTYTEFMQKQRIILYNLHKENE